MDYTVAVRTLCEFTAKQGDLDLRFTPLATAQEGVAGHVLAASEKFSSVASAQAHCAGGAVVWVNTGHSRLFHSASSKYFGKTRHGAYVCEKSALAAGYHAAKH